ncbi:MAG: 4-hydroxy-3-methylbut-2-enyl diphosphate reductase [Bacteroidetes bacterium]|nr:4-hydroxy-3-methylbut-2-enyl diphosphate reductase [Bacteroidota bacterium]
MKEKLTLTVVINPASGFCFGVINAIRKAESLLDQGQEVYCVGQIVHNDEEVKRLEKKGLNTISLHDLEELQGKNVLFRAHGEPQSSYSLAGKNDNRVVDASCRVVLKLQDRIRDSFNNNENIYIFGKKNHPEVIGLVAQSRGNAIVFESLEELNRIDLPGEITLYSQTTMSLSKYTEIANYLENKGVKENLNDTVCRQVHNREEKLDKFCRKFDVVIFVAGKESSNGKVLFNICQKANKNSHFISSPRDIRSDWFKPGQAVGISGATSTPLWLMEAVKTGLEQL